MPQTEKEEEEIDAPSAPEGMNSPHSLIGFAGLPSVMVMVLESSTSAFAHDQRTNVGEAALLFALVFGHRLPRPLKQQEEGQN